MLNNNVEVNIKTLEFDITQQSRPLQVTRYTRHVMTVVHACMPCPAQTQHCQSLDVCQDFNSVKKLHISDDGELWTSSVFTGTDGGCRQLWWRHAPTMMSRNVTCEFSAGWRWSLWRHTEDMTIERSEQNLSSY